MLIIGARCALSLKPDIDTLRFMLDGVPNGDTVHDTRSIKVIIKVKRYLLISLAIHFVDLFALAIDGFRQ